jgi:hypothetical protein
MLNNDCATFIPSILIVSVTGEYPGVRNIVIIRIIKINNAPKNPNRTSILLSFIATIIISPKISNKYSLKSYIFVHQIIMKSYL